MAENKTFSNKSELDRYFCLSSEKITVDYQDWVLHFGAAIVYFVTVLIVYIVITFIRKLLISPENILFMAVLSSGWLSAMLWYIPSHIIRIIEYNKEVNFVRCHGFTYNEISQYPACRINFISFFLAIQFLLDVSMFSLTVLSCLKLVAVQFPIWSKCHVTTKYSYRGICVTVIISGILNVPEILFRNFPSSDNHTVCLDIIQEKFIIPHRVAAYCWLVLYSLSFIIIVTSAIFIIRGVTKHKTNDTQHCNRTLAKKHINSFVKNIVILSVFASSESIIFVLKCDVKLNMFRIFEYANQYLELASLIGLIMCILLYVSISGNIRKALFWNNCRSCSIEFEPSNQFDTPVNNSRPALYRGITCNYKCENLNMTRHR